ncbi:MAG TPA: hypothetical protein VHL31_11370 [Geminicoccus sp.]|jgi:hypothetical protein|nr:hypothetical protein [Geminicoccus sp.]HEX2526880.1 hypothetical protein [Geminicoccus sp.]
MNDGRYDQRQVHRDNRDRDHSSRPCTCAGGDVASTAVKLSTIRFQIQAYEPPSEVRLLSDAMYTKTLQASSRLGLRFTPEQVANGYKRHLEELRLQLLDQGYLIIEGQQETRVGYLCPQPVDSGCPSRPVEQTASEIADGDGPTLSTIE